MLDAFTDKRIMVVFTKKFQHESFLSFYQKSNVTTIDISNEADNKRQYWKSFVARGRWGYYINSMQQHPAVFIGQCNFGYKITPHLKKRIRVVELIHVAEKKFAWITFPFIPLLDERIAPGNSIVQQHLAYYTKLGVPTQYNSRWRVITYRLPIMPAYLAKRDYSLPLKVYYAGRGGYQKRLWLIMEIIRQCAARHLPVEFHLAGPITNEIAADVSPLIHYHGQITTTEAMYQLHQSMDILLMTSTFEGFPLVIQEAMANGAIPMVTAVDVIPEHIVDGVNGFLLQDAANEAGVILQAVTQLSNICNHPSSLLSISEAAHQYAKQQFGQDQFNAGYREALFPKFL